MTIVSFRKESSTSSCPPHWNSLCCNCCISFLVMYPCTTKTREVLWNRPPLPSRFPPTLEISLGLRLREISRVSGNLSGVGDGFTNTSLILVEYILSSSIFLQGVDQETLPCGQGRIDSVEINPSLLMIREWKWLQSTVGTYLTLCWSGFSKPGTAFMLDVKFFSFWSLYTFPQKVTVCPLLLLLKPWAQHQCAEAWKCLLVLITMQSHHMPWKKT